MASKGVPQQQSAVGLAMDDQEPRARADEIPELRRGSTIPRGRYLASDLPPLHTLTEIFADMASNALKMGFEHVLSRLGSRPLRVATMCSGTEAPLLALELIQTGMCSAVCCFCFFCFPSFLHLFVCFFDVHVEVNGGRGWFHGWGHPVARSSHMSPSLP